MPNSTLSQRSRPSHNLLAPEAAMSSRIISQRLVPTGFLRWLANPSRSEPCAQEFRARRVEASFEELLEPLLVSATAWEKRQVADAPVHMAAISHWIDNRCSQLDLNGGNRRLAACLLPMYRCMADGDLHGGFEQTRYRMLETLALVALHEELGVDDMNEVLGTAEHQEQSPHATFQQALGLNSIAIARLLSQSVRGLESDNQSADLNHLWDATPTEMQSMKNAADWANPDLLWQLAGELLSQKSEIVLPRSWLDTPVSWNTVGEHWRKLEHRLKSEATTQGLTAASRPANRNPAQSATPGGPASQPSPTNASTHRDVPPTSTNTTTPSATGADSTAPTDSANSTDAGSSAQSSAGVGLAAASSPAASSPAVGSTGSSRGLLPTAAGQVAKPVEEQESTDDSNSIQPDLVDSHVLVAEVMSHSDPAFTKFVQRQLVTCRHETIGLSLVAVAVELDDEQARKAVMGSRNYGAKPWQQRLITCIQEHSEVQDPMVFLTSSGELLLCLSELDRDEAGRVVRAALQDLCDHDGPSNLNVSASAFRYYAGIASTGVPGVNMRPEDVVGPMWRCLEAASQQSKSAIKSIEVY